MRCLLYVLLALPITVLAQDKAEDWPEGSAMNTGLAANERADKADKELNVLYQRIIKARPKDEPDNYPRRVLIAAERSWIKYRDDQCALVGEVSGGVRMWKSAYGSVCRADLTEARIKELKELFEGEGQ